MLSRSEGHRDLLSYRRIWSQLKTVGTGCAREANEFIECDFTKFLVARENDEGSRTSRRTRRRCCIEFNNAILGVALSLPEDERCQKQNHYNYCSHRIPLYFYAGSYPLQIAQFNNANRTSCVPRLFGEGAFAVP